MPLRTNAVVLPASPIPATSVKTTGLYVSRVKRLVGPMLSQRSSGRSKIGAMAKPAAGSTMIAPARPPSAAPTAVKAFRRVIDSPSKYPGGSGFGRAPSPGEPFVLSAASAT